MKKGDTLGLAVLEEVVIFFALIGLGTVTWLAKGDGTNWWRGAVPEVATAYVIRFAVDLWLNYRKKPRLHLAFEEAG